MVLVKATSTVCGDDDDIAADLFVYWYWDCADCNDFVGDDCDGVVDGDGDGDGDSDGDDDHHDDDDDDYDDEELLLTCFIDLLDS